MGRGAGAGGRRDRPRVGGRPTPGWRSLHDNERNLVLKEHDGTGVFILGDGPQADLFEHKVDGVIVMLTASTIFLLYAFLVFFLS